MNRFTKSERIHSKSEIDSLFLTGESLFVYPFKIIIKTSDTVSLPRVKILISVPKKKYSKAVDRNRIKRLIRESYRLNKNVLLNHLNDNHPSLQIAFIYVDKKIAPYSSIEKSMIKSLDKILSWIQSKPKQD